MNPSKAWPLNLKKFLRMLPAANNEDRRPLQIHFIGLWDTVAALGAPPNSTPRLKQLIKHWTEKHTDVLPHHITHARHALALHELRGDYEPVLWTGRTKEQSLKQCWFAGNHSGVGGGYAQTALSDAALRWMAVEAVACGLEVNPGWTPGQIVPGTNLGGVHNEIQWFNIGDPTLRRRLDPGSIASAAPGLVQSTHVHKSVLDRLSRLGSFSYRSWDRNHRSVGRSLSEVDLLTMPLFLHHYFTQGNTLETR